VAARARELLFSGGNYMTLVFALVICMPPIFLAYITPMIVADYVYEWIPIAILALLEFLIGGPVLLGTVNVAVALYRGSSAPLSEIFFAFESPRTYFKSLLLTLIQLGKIVLELLSAIIVYSLIDGLPALAKVPSLSRGILALLGAIAAVAVVKTLLSRLYGVLFFAFDSDELRIGRAIAASWRSCKGKTLQTVATRLGFLPLFAVSVIPLGIPLLLYTVPYMLCAYVYGMAHIEDGKITVAETAGPVSDGSEENEEMEINENGDINNE